MSEENKNVFDLPEDVKESLGFLNELKKEKEAKRKVDQVKAEYLKDETKKMIWEAGFGEKLEQNFLKVTDEDWVQGQLDVALDRIKLRAELAKQAAEAQQNENEGKPPAQPGSGSEPVIGNESQDFNKASQEVFFNEEFKKKLTKEQQIFLDVNAPSKNPAWY